MMTDDRTELSTTRQDTTEQTGICSYIGLGRYLEIKSVHNRSRRATGPYAVETLPMIDQVEPATFTVVNTFVFRDFEAALLWAGSAVYGEEPVDFRIVRIRPATKFERDTLYESRGDAE